MELADVHAVKYSATIEDVFNKYSDMVYRLAFVRTKSTADSDDILQNVFLRYIKVHNKMQSDEHVKSMLLRITINCSNTLKTSAWFKRTEALTETITYNDSNDKETINAVLSLPIKYRTVIHLYYYFGYSVEEIAKILNSNPNTVKTHLLRARKLLKNILKDDEL